MLSKTSGLTDLHKEVAKAALSNMLGGLGYFYGKELVEEEVNGEKGKQTKLLKKKKSCLSHQNKTLFFFLCVVLDQIFLLFFKGAGNCFRPFFMKISSTSIKRHLFFVCVFF
jgi:hypothetical protein